MNKRLTKSISFLLTAAMLLLSFGAVLFVYAEENPTYPTYADAADGDLLYRVDFRGADGIYAPTSVNTDNTGHKVNTSSEDGTSLTLQGNNFFGGPVKDLPLGEDTTYTITYDVERTTRTPQGLGIDMGSATRCNNNFYGDSTQVRYMIGGSNGDTGYRVFSNLGFTVKNAGNAAGKPQSYKIVVDGPSMMFSFYVLLANGTYGLVESMKLASLKSDELHLIFRTYQTTQANYADVVFSNVCVYKGFLNNMAVPGSAKGELLLDLGDLSQPAVGAHGATYTPDIDEQHSQRQTDMEFSYDPDTNTNIVSAPKEILNSETNTTVLFGGTTNLRLGYGQQYTVTYLTKFVPNISSGAGTGIRYSASDYTSSQGVYLTPTDVCVARGTLTGSNGCHPYVKYTPNVNGYNEIAVEINGYQVTVYVNGENLVSYSTLDEERHPFGRVSAGFSTDCLTVAMQDYVGKLAELVPSQEWSCYKDIKVYSGLVVSSDYIEVKDGENVEYRAYEKGTDYTLPVWCREGYVFFGWMLNGEADSLLTAGETVPSSTGKNRVEAVYEQNRETLWVQFKDNGNDSQDMRVVGLLDSLNYQEIGYRMTIRYTENGTEKAITEERFQLGYVYTSLSAKYGTEVVTAESLGCRSSAYLTAFTIRNLPTNMGTITIELIPYAQGMTDATPVYAEELNTTITIVNGHLLE